MRSSSNPILSLLLSALAVTASPAPRDTGCTDASFKSVEFWVADLSYHASYIFTTPAHQNSWGYVSFNLTNTAVGTGHSHFLDCQAESDQLEDFFYGNQWYTCTPPANETSKDVGGTSARFMFDRDGGKLVVNEVWTCLDKGYPVTFNATGTASPVLDCTDTTWQNPNWTWPNSAGDIYSDREVKCNPVRLEFPPSEISAVA